MGDTGQPGLFRVFSVVLELIHFGHYRRPRHGHTIGTQSCTNSDHVWLAYC